MKRKSPECILEELAQRCPALSDCLPDIEAVYEALRDCYASGGKLLVCGNGGSAADCEHIVGELMKGFLLRRPLKPEEKEALSGLGEEGRYLASHLQGALPCISLCGHPSLQSAFGNDVDPALSLAQQVHGYGREGDALLAISTSGNAKNVHYAALTARSRGMRTIGLTGAAGGRLAETCELCIRVPSAETYRIQEYHLPVYHALCAMLESHFFPDEAE